MLYTWLLCERYTLQQFIMCNIHDDIEKKSVTVWILVFCLLLGYYRTRIQYLSTLLRPAQAHKHFHFPATALYFWVLGIQHPPVKKKNEFEIKEMERFIAQKIITGSVRLEIRGPLGPRCTRHPLKRLWTNLGVRGGGGEGEKSRKPEKTGTGEGEWKKGSLRSSLGSIFLGNSLPEGLLRKYHRCGQVPLYFEW